MDLSNLGLEIRKLRKLHGLTQQELADRVGLSRSALALIESGKRGLQAVELIRIADCFGMTVEQLADPPLRPKSVVNGAEKSSSAKKGVMRISIPRDNYEKFREVLLYVLSRVGAKPHVGQTVIYKLLYFIDFDYYEKYEEQLIGATYIKNKYGPTPTHFAKVIEDMIENGDVEEISSKYFSYPQKKYLPVRHPDLSKLSGREVELIDEVLARLGEMNGRMLSEYSHKDVPWMSAEEGDKLDYETVFYRTPEYSVRAYDEEEDH